VYPILSQFSPVHTFTTSSQRNNSIIFQSLYGSFRWSLTLFYTFFDFGTEILSQRQTSYRDLTFRICTGGLFVPREGPLAGSCEHRLEVLKITIMKNPVFWDIMTSSLLKVYQHFEAMYSLHPQGHRYFCFVYSLPTKMGIVYMFSHIPF
jgi:hypothetical protein